ncbi:UDP-N-acetylglucosamine 2-epimerase [Candidatus Thioglobus sp.]|nr:UDP-N-acetylglucosamine 2-epimerase [Candidatus Thioglobus sp.]
MTKRKICVVTGTRAEYGLLYWLMKEINDDDAMELQLVVTGMHLSEEFGNTYKQIEKDGFAIDNKVDISLTSDTEIAISKSMGIGIIGFADVFNDLKPELIVVLGDRFEIFSAVSAAMIAKIPIAHIHGGESTEGVIDEPIRHSITKMSHLHFAATEEYRNRIIQLGEQPNSVFNVGGLGLDNINKLKLLSKVDFEDAINFKLGDKNILVTFHPVTLEKSTSESQFQELLMSITNLKNTKIIFTKANSDTDGRIINSMVDDYVAKNDNTIAFKSMGQLNYLSALQFMDAVLGNSSSGLIEAPSFKIGTIDIGDRQKGRIKATSVLSCLPKKESIDSALVKLYSQKFQDNINKVVNPYGLGGASKKIVKIIKNTNLDNIVKKSFFNLKSDF